VVQAQALHHLRGQVVGVGDTRRGLDDEAEQRVADVGVLEALIGRVDRGPGADQPTQGRLVGERSLELPEVGVEAVAGQPAGVGEQLPESHVAGRRAGERQPPAQPVVQAQAAGLVQLHDRRGGERLGV